MKKKLLTIFLSTAMVSATIMGCGSDSAQPATTAGSENSAAAEAPAEASAESSAAASSDTATDTASDEAKDKSALAASFEEFIGTLAAGQSYTYAPICDGEDALLVTNYTFDDSEGHQATYKATIYIMGASGGVEKVTTIETTGTAYPLAVTADNDLILSRRNSVQRAHVDKASGKYVITEESNVEFGETETYHNYTKADGKIDISSDAALYDELSDLYSKSEILSFEPAGISSDGSPRFAGAVYTESLEGDSGFIAGYYAFKDETTGFTQTSDGISSIPFDYEVNGTDIMFHFGSPDDESKATYSAEYHSFPTLTFAGDDKSGSYTQTLSCLENADPETFDAATYFDNDDALLMQVSSFDDTSFTGDLYHEEKIAADEVEKAKVGDILYSNNATQFTAVSFEDVNKELDYGTDAEFKESVVGSADSDTRFDKFLVKCTDDNFYYALYKTEYSNEYTVVALMTEESLKKELAKNVTYTIREDSQINLLKFVTNEESGTTENVYIIGREFKADNYPGWSDGATEYFLSTDMLLSILVTDGEITYASQQYVP